MGETNEHYLAMLTLSQFKAFRKALATLTRAGVSVDIAIDFLCQQGKERRAKLHRYSA